VCGSGWRTDNAYSGDLAGRLVIRLAGRLPADQAQRLYHVTGSGEYELALEDLAGMLVYGKIAITGTVRADMRALARRMPLKGDRVPDALVAANSPRSPDFVRRSTRAATAASAV